MIGRLMALMEGPESLASWAPPEMPPPLHELLPWRAWDPASELYVNARSHGFVLELPPFAGIDEETLGALSGTLADAAPEHCTIQAIHWASPRFGAPLAAWAEARAEKSGARATMARCRREMFAHAGWRPLHEGGPPYTLSDYLHGDHIDSHDSRYAEIGPVPADRILGRAIARPDLPWLGLKGPLAGPEDVRAGESGEARR